MGDNFQINTWGSDFGKEYTDRNTFDTQGLNDLYHKEYGISRTEMNKKFLVDINLIDGRILEVGCNVGNQLRLLQEMGFKNLYGIELQEYAVEKAKSLTKGINIIQGTGDNIPFKDGFFDMVFTSGVLIHISPSNIENVMDEIYRCTRKYIWGFEYYADEYTTVAYRGNQDLLWKTNYARLYLEKYPGLKLVKEEKYQYVHSDNVDSMFILEKCR